VALNFILLTDSSKFERMKENERHNATTDILMAHMTINIKTLGHFSRFLYLLLYFIVFPTL